jgi:hypothetical protein
MCCFRAFAYMPHRVMLEMGISLVEIAPNLETKVYVKNSHSRRLNAVNNLLKNGRHSDT